MQFSSEIKTGKHHWHAAFVQLFRNRLKIFFRIALAMFFVAGFSVFCSGKGKKYLLAGAAKMEITDESAGPVVSPPHVRALVLDDGSGKFAVITVDAVALKAIGPVKNSYLSTVKKQLNEKFGISAGRVLFNASHCHAKVAHVEERTIGAVRQAIRNMERVTVGSGSGREDRIMINRRFLLKDGTTIDERRAYSMPPDEEIAGIGPVDPEIGLLKLVRKNGTTLAVIYNFAMHPIQGVPGGENTADVTGFASTIIENNLGHGAVALFIQGCAGDVNPINYKMIAQPRDAEPLGNLLGLSTLKALSQIATGEPAVIRTITLNLKLPRRNNSTYIEKLETERENLVRSLTGTSLNLKSFLSLIYRYKLYPDDPSAYRTRYMRDLQMQRKDMTAMDEINSADMESYIRNVYIMEKLTRINENLRLLKMHQKEYDADPEKTVHAELMGLRIGDFRLITFPGELSVQIGLNIKKKSPYEKTFIAGYSNGYIYYTPTEEQLKNAGNAQEDSDCQVAPGWQEIFESKVSEILGKL